ncbi:hypothetical protein BV25DRAFT_1823684, partial [Artomyces pyxidatus]
MAIGSQGEAQQQIEKLAGVYTVSLYLCLTASSCVPAFLGLFSTDVVPLGAVTEPVKCAAATCLRPDEPSSPVDAPPSWRTVTFDPRPKLPCPGDWLMPS